MLEPHEAIPAQLAEPLFQALYARLSSPLRQEERIHGLNDLVPVLAALQTPHPKAFTVITNLVWRLVDQDPSEDLALAAVDVLRTLVVDLRQEACEFYQYIVELCIGWATQLGPKSLRVKALEVLEHIGEHDRCMVFFPGVTSACVNLLDAQGDVKCGSNVLVAALKTWEVWIRRNTVIPADTDASLFLLTLAPSTDSAGVSDIATDDVSAASKKMRQALTYTGCMITKIFEGDQSQSCVQAATKNNHKVRKAAVNFVHTALRVHHLPAIARQTCADFLATLTQTNVAEDAKVVLRAVLQEQPDLRVRLQGRLASLLKAACASSLSDTCDSRITRITGYLVYLRDVCEPLVFIDDLLPPLFHLCAMSITSSARGVFRDQHPLRYNAPNLHLHLGAEDNEDDNDASCPQETTSPDNTRDRSSIAEALCRPMIHADEHLVRNWLHQAMTRPGTLVDDVLDAFVRACDVDLLFQAILESDNARTIERAYVLARWVGRAPRYAPTCVEMALDMLAQKCLWNQRPLHYCVALFLLRAALRVMESTAIHRAMCRIFLPILVQLGSSHLVTSHAAYCVLEDIHARLHCCTGNDGDKDTAPVISSLLAQYSDYVVNDLTARLKLNITTSHNDSVAPALALAVTAHMGADHSTLPFLKDVVHLLLPLEVADSTTSWVVQSLAHIVAQLSANVTKRRTAALEAAGYSTATSSTTMPTLSNTSYGTNCDKKSPLLHYFTSGGQWSTDSRDGFCVDNGLTFDEDPTPPDNDDTPSKYGAERAVALDILHRAKHHLAEANVHVRHMAHVCIHHAIIVLSTRIDDLLPAVHTVMKNLHHSFDPTLHCERIRIMSLHILRAIARFSGENIARRIGDLLPTLLDTAHNDRKNDEPRDSASPSWHRHMLGLIRFWAGDDRLIPTQSLPCVLRYAATHLRCPTNKRRAEKLVRALGPLNIGALRATLDGMDARTDTAEHHIDAASLMAPIPRRPRIALTPWATFPSDLVA